MLTAGGPCQCRRCRMSEAEANEVLWLEEMRARWIARQEQLAAEREMLEQDRIEALQEAESADDY